MRLTEEIILLLLNEESGYLEQVAGWNLSCVLAGAVLADLDLESRIDTAHETLALDDASLVGDDLLDPVLAAIADDPEPRSVSYWAREIPALGRDTIMLSGGVEHGSGLCERALVSLRNAQMRLQYIRAIRQ